MAPWLAACDAPKVCLHLLSLWDPLGEEEEVSTPPVVPIIRLRGGPTVGGHGEAVSAKAHTDDLRATPCVPGKACDCLGRLQHHQRGEVDAVVGVVVVTTLTLHLDSQGLQVEDGLRLAEWGPGDHRRGIAASDRDRHP